MARIILLSILILQSFDLLAQLKFSVEGKDFWFTIMPNFASQSGANSAASDSILLVISSKVNTSGVVENQAFGYSIPFTVNAFQVTNIPIRNSRGASLISQVIDSTAIHIYSDDTITAFVANMQSATRDATNLIPTNALGKSYMVSSYANVQIGISQFAIVATEDDTELTIVPSAPTNGGNAAGVPFNITLNRGQTYLVQGDSNGHDLTGSTVTSMESGTACSNFAVFAGTSCTNIPFGCTACDQVFSIMNPIAAWGKEYLIAPFQQDSVSVYRILALNDNSPVYIDGNLTTTLNSGEHHTVYLDSNARCITSDSLIYVTQFLPGFSCSANGDPAMLVVNSIDQGVTGAIFTTIDVYGTGDTNFATIITSAEGISNVTHNGNPIDSSNFVQFPYCPDYYYCYISLQIGAHVVQSTNKFSLYAYGMTTADSYAFSAGSVIPVDGEILDANCATSKAVFTVDTALVDAWWHPLGNWNDTLGTGTTLILNPPILPGIYVYSGFSTITGCREDKFFEIVNPRTDLAIMALSDRSIVCPGEEVQLSALVRNQSFSENFAALPGSSQFTVFENVEVGNTCGYYAGNSLHFNGDTVRRITTTDQDLTGGGFIEFMALGLTTCDPPEQEDVLIVEYSTNGGANYVATDTLIFSDYTVFKRFRTLIPSPAQTSSTRYRVRQGGTYSINDDVWILDDFQMFATSPDPFDSVRWTPSLQVSDSISLNTLGSPSDSTWFNVFIRDTLHCSFTDSVLVYWADTLPEPTSFDTVICEGGLFVFIADSGSTYSWSPTAGVSDPNGQTVTLNPTASVDYLVTIGDEFGCDSVTQSVKITLTYPPNVAGFGDTVLCDGAVMALTIDTTGNSILWSTGDAGNAITISKSGTYWYQVTNPCGLFVDTMKVKRAEPIYIDLGKDINLCRDERFEIDLPKDDLTYIWSDDLRDSKRTITAPGVYSVTVTNGLGCQAYDSLIVYDTCETLVEYYNVFTPNSDGLNDHLVIHVKNASEIRIQVYNRWGTIVFSSDHPVTRWDGNVNGEAATEGVYFLVIQYKSYEGTLQRHQGSVNLIRD